MKRATQFIYLLGAYKIGTHVYEFGKTYQNSKLEDFQLKKQLNEKYGEGGQWALVTGASEGIGKSYALELAKAGFNIKICARSVDKL